jgi:hypothetical protein
MSGVDVVVCVCVVFCVEYRGWVKGKGIEEMGSKSWLGMDYE